MDYKDKLKKIYNHFGYNTQVAKLKEELNELLYAINNNDTENMIEEIADVYVVIMQMISFFGEGSMSKIIEYKIDRTINRIGSGFYERK